jgi:hypothetical protein
MPRLKRGGFSVYAIFYFTTLPKLAVGLSRIVFISQPMICLCLDIEGIGIYTVTVSERRGTLHSPRITAACVAAEPTRTFCVPYHRRFAARFPSAPATGSDRKSSPNTWASEVSKASQTAKHGPRQSRRMRCRASSSVCPATPSPVA